MKKKILTILFLLVVAVVPVMGMNTTLAMAEESHTVVFKLNEETVYQEVTVNHNGYVVIPETPVKNGAYFKYWKNGDKKFSFKTKIKSDLTLIAEWEILETLHTVTFVVDGNIVNKQDVKEGEDAIEPISFDLLESKEFVAWNEEFTNVRSDLVVAAILKDKECRVKYIGYDGNVIAEKSVVYGNYAQPLESSLIPRVSNYEFLEFEGIEQAIIEDCEIKLIYKPCQYTISFYADGDSFYSKEVDFGKVIPFPPLTPSKTGYIFVGWYLEEEGGEPINFSNRVSKDMTCYAHFEAIERPKYEVRFYDAKGNQHGGTQTIEEGKSAIEPGEPYYEGHTFLEWSCDFSNVTKNLDVYPMYELNDCTLTLIDDFGEIERITLKYGEKIPTDIKTKVRAKEGFDFSGWDKTVTNIKEDTVLTAQYSKKSFYVIFINSQGLLSSQMVLFGEDAKEPINKNIKGYDFKYWQTTDELGNVVQGETIYKNVRYNCVFNGVYERQTFKVTFYDGETVKHTTNIESGNKISPYSYEKTNYIFKGWYIDETFTTLYSFDSQVYATVNLYAQWEEKPLVTYTVNFYVDDTIYDSQIVGENGNAILPSTPEKTGHRFVGWFVEDQEFVITNISSNIDVMAKFEKLQFDVVFIYGNPTSTPTMQTITVEYGEKASAPEDIEVTGYTFKGWNTTEEELNNVTKKMYVYANYEIKVYDVNFYVGEQLVRAQSIAFEHSPLQFTPEKEGYKFIGWKTIDDTDYNFEPIVESLNLYAQFEIQKYDLIVFLNGEEILVEAIEHATLLSQVLPSVEDVLATIDEEQREDSIFLGWGNIPEKMPNHTLVVSGKTRTYRYYAITYMFNNQVFYTQSVKEGSDIEIIELEPNDTEFLTFVEWDVSNLSYEKMPNKNLVVYAKTISHAYYTITYIVNDSVYKTIQVIDGESVPKNEGIPSNLSNKFIFESWNYDTIPDVMPTNNLYVYANVRAKQTYSISYYIENTLYRTKYYLEGDEVIKLSSPYVAEETLKFNGWIEEPNVMPAENITIRADVTRLYYYTVKLIIDGKLYKQFEVLQSKPIILEDPVDLPDDVTFVNWIDVPNVMPAEDITINAEIIKKEYYNVEYYVNGELYKTVTLLEGESVTPCEAPNNVSDEFEFIGWMEEPSEMPNRNVRVDAKLKVVADNYIQVTYERSYEVDKALFIDIEVVGNVNIAGIQGEFTIDCSYGIIEFISSNGYANSVGNKVKFVWSQGENAYEPVVVMKLKLFNIDQGVDVSKDISLRIEKCLAFNNEGEIISVGYTSNII